jgi:hypothetical protein
VSRATEPKGPPTTIPNTWRAEFRYTGPGNVIASNVYWGYSPTFTGATGQCQTVAQAYSTAWQYEATGPPVVQSLIYMLSPAWTLTEIVVSDNGGTTDNFYVLPVGLAGLSTLTGPVLSPNVAAVVSWDIDQKYKGGHPRTYLPGIESAAVAVAGANTWTTAFVSALKAAALAFLQQLIATLISAGFSSAQAITVSRFRGNAALPAAKMYPITNSSANPPIVNSRIDSQRRRLGKEVTAR